MLIVYIYSILKITSEIFTIWPRRWSSYLALKFASRSNCYISFGQLKFFWTRTRIIFHVHRIPRHDLDEYRCYLNIFCSDLRRNDLIDETSTRFGTLLRRRGIYRLPNWVKLSFVIIIASWDYRPDITFLVKILFSQLTRQLRLEGQTDSELLAYAWCLRAVGWFPTKVCRDSNLDPKVKFCFH